MSDAPPRIDFPCEYPIKVLGENGVGFRHAVLQAFARHVGELKPEQVSARESSAGKYLAVTVTIVATGTEQLEQITAELRQVPGLRLVL